MAMRLAADPEAAVWLDRLRDEPETFDWDRGNRAKLGKHDVTPEEVESILASPSVFAGRVVEPAHDESRWLLLGQSANGRHLTLIFTRRGDRLRTISCRPMRRNERRVYEEAISEDH
jgi:uncharacterized DUF497 family protein